MSKPIEEINYRGLAVQQSNARHELELTWWSPDWEQSFRLKIPFGEAMAFMRQVSNHGGYLAENALHAALTGECETCNNIRLVDQPRHGHQNLVRCPDCGERFDNPPPIPGVRPQEAKDGPE